MKSHADDNARVFGNRRAAGEQLGAWLARHRPVGELLVLGLPRGGVPVAYEVARSLDAPLDVLVVRKLGARFDPELAVGAIASGGIAVYNDEALADLGLDESDLQPIIAKEEAELGRRERVYRLGKPLPAIAGKTVILVDDGIATGATMRAAVDAIKSMGAARIIVAAPTGSRQAVEQLERSADVVAVLSVPEPYVAVGRWYDDFPQLDDREVTDLLQAYARRHPRDSSPAGGESP